MKRILLIFLLLLPALTLGAQDVKEAIQAFSVKVAAVECDFTQTKESSLLAEAAISTGHMTFRRPAYLEWQYLTPTPYTFVYDGEQPGQNRMMKEMARLITGSIEGSALTDEKLFKTQYEESNGTIAVTLIPKRREMQKIWSSLVLFYEKDSLHATRFELHEASGDLTTITFSNVHYDFSE